MSDTLPIVDLRSDTLSQPTQAMREAMATAEVGDDVFGEDPTVNRLQDRCAALFAKEAALFVPTGTMANLLAFLAQTRPGETIILHEDAHPYNYEAGNVAMIGGLMTRTLPGDLGILDRDTIAPCVIRTEDHHFSETSLIAVENTTNRGGGNIYPLETLREIRALADENGMKVHCDGARLFNAVVESGHSAQDFAEHCDTVSVCFSKGLGAPAGSILAGSAETIDTAHKFRKMLGGGMRQSGILAAAALHALDHHVERLAEDHRRASQFRTELEGLPGVSVPMPTPTNIVMLDVPDAAAFAAKIKGHGVLMMPMGRNRIRAVFHLDIDDEGLDRAIQACQSAF